MYCKHKYTISAVIQEKQVKIFFFLPHILVSRQLQGIMFSSKASVYLNAVITSCRFSSKWSPERL